MSIWIIRHVDQERLGHIPGILDELGLPYRSISLSKKEPLPSLDEVSGVITMGGPMSAYDKPDHAWIEKEEAFLREAHERNIPILGICLGGQILAQAFGAKIHKAPQPEIGWFPLSKTTDQSDPLLEGLELPDFYQNHNDIFDLPEGAINFLKSDLTKNQMFRLGENTYGIQFHPEANEAMLRSVMEQYSQNLPPGAVEASLKDIEPKAAKGREFLVEMLKRLFVQ